MKSSPINASQVECGEPPLYLRRQYLLDRYLTRCFQLSNHPDLSKFPFKAKCRPITISIRNLLQKCVEKGLVVKFVWIPNHCRIKGNERADQLANEAIDNLFPFLNYCHNLSCLPRIYLQERWREIWEKSSLTKAKYYKQI